MEPFVQLDNHLSKRFAGTGLGLALVSSPARLHGVDLAVKSAPNVGTAIRINFPRGRTGGTGASHAA